MNRIKSFDGLRGIFAILIFLNHCSFMTEFGEPVEKVFECIFHNGGFCVLFFFLLSGFCTYVGYEDKFESISTEKYLSFLKRRIQKIYVPYMLTMIWAMLYRCIVLEENLQTNIMKLFFSATMLQTVDVKHWDILNSAAWFISCIWVIYLITPWLLKKLTKIKDVRKFFKIMVLLYFLVIGIRLLFSCMKRYQLISYETADLMCYVWPFIRIFDFGIGMSLGAIFMKTKDTGILRHKTIWEMFGVVMTLIAWMVSLNVKQHTEYAFIYTIPVLVLLIYVFAFDSGKASEFLSKKVFAQLGRYSMNIYLFHYVVIWSGGWKLCEKIISDYTIYNLCIILAIMFLSTLLISYLAERRILRRQNNKE